MRLRLPDLRRDEGFNALETVILAPAALLMIVAMIYAGRYASVASSIEGSAYAAARAASLERTSGPARAAAASAARASLASSGVRCSPDVSADTSGFSAPVGTPAQVRVNVTCRVNFTDLGLPGVPGQRTMRAQALSPVDAYRERS